MIFLVTDMPEGEKNGRVQLYKMPTLNVMDYCPFGDLKSKNQHLPRALQGKIERELFSLFHQIKR